MTWRITTEHYELEEGHWWHCQFPERPPEPIKSHYKRGCRGCLVAFMAEAQRPPERQTFLQGGVRVAAYDLALVQEWWFIASQEEMDAFMARPDVVAHKQKYPGRS